MMKHGLHRKTQDCRRDACAHAGRRHGGHHHGGEQQEQDMLTRGRKFAARELQLMFLALLAQQPRHGYELIREIEQRSQGVYVPSPGVVYPALTYLEETGLIEVEADGNRKLYRVSPAGQTALSTQQEQVDYLLASLVHLGKKMAAIRQAMNNQQEESDHQGWLAEYLQTRRELKRVLVMKADADHAEQRRISHILRQAIQQIEQGDAHAK
jgi:DNA-binding PadR family transcriptional regulator